MLLQYFCTFENVKRDEANDCQKRFGEAVGNYWKPFTYEKWVQDAIKVEAKIRQLEAKKCSPCTVHGEVLTYISNELKSRQYKYPLVEEFIDNLFSKFVNFVRKDRGCNFLTKKIERWFNDNSGHGEKEFTFRFRGKVSITLGIFHLS